MCAAVPCTPVVVTLPFTEPSLPMVKRPSPLAEVETGGTSSAPVRFTREPPIRLPMLPQAARPSTAIANAAFLTRVIVCSLVGMQIEIAPIEATPGPLKYSHAEDIRVHRARSAARARSVARTRRSHLRQAVRRFRRRCPEDRVAARGRSERRHGRAARWARHAEPAPQQALDDAQPEASRGARGFRAAGENRRCGGGELPARRQVSPGDRFFFPGKNKSQDHP